MVSATSFTTSAIAIIGLLQMCPAPPAIVAAVAGGATAGAIGAGGALCTKYCPDAKKREALSPTLLATKRQIPAGVSQESIDQCTQQVSDQFSSSGVSVEIVDNGETSVLVNNVPPACMNLATVLTGNPAQAGGAVPIPMSSSSLEYQGITVADRQALAAALNA